MNKAESEELGLTFSEFSTSYDPMLSSGLLSLSTRTPSAPLVGWNCCHATETHRTLWSTFHLSNVSNVVLKFYLHCVSHRRGSKTSVHSPASPWLGTLRRRTNGSPKHNLNRCIEAWASGGKTTYTHTHTHICGDKQVSSTGKCNNDNNAFLFGHKLTSWALCLTKGVTSAPSGSRLSSAVCPSQGTQ